MNNISPKLRFKYLVLGVFIGLTISCEHQKISIKKDLIHKLANYKPTSPSPEIALALFFKSSDGELCKMSITDLLGVYHKHYTKQYPDLEKFISKTLNQEIALDTAGFPRYWDVAIFSPDNDVTADFRKLPFSEFRKKYCSPLEAKSFKVEDRKLNANQLNTVLYYFFINNYYVVFSDYAGYYAVGIYD